MKKIMLSLLAIAATVNVMAINVDAKAKITISAGGEATTLLLVESPDLNEGWNNGYCGEIFDLNEYPLALYIQYGGKNYSSFGTKDLTATDIVLKAKDNGAASYTITVSNVSGTKPLRLVFGATEIPFVDGTYTLTPAELAAATKVADAPAAPEFCFVNEELKVNGFAGKKLAIWNADKTTAIVPEFTLGDTYVRDFSGEAANSKFIIVFDGLPAVAPVQKDYVIDVKPAVTKVNP